MFERSPENKIRPSNNQNEMPGSASAISDHYFGGKILLSQKPNVTVNPVGEDLIRRHSESMSNRPGTQNVSGQHQQTVGQIPQNFDSSSPQMYANLLAATKNFSEPLLRAGGIPLLSFGYDLFSKFYDPIQNYLRQFMSMYKISSYDNVGKKGVKEVTRKLTRKLRDKFLKKLIVDSKIASHERFEDRGLMIEKASFYQDLNPEDRIRYLYTPMQQKTREMYGNQRLPSPNPATQNKNVGGINTQPHATPGSGIVGAKTEQESPISDHQDRPIPADKIRDLMRDNRVVYRRDIDRTNEMKTLGRMTLRPEDVDDSWFRKFMAGFDYARRGYKDTPYLVPEEHTKARSFRLGNTLGGIYAHLGPPDIKSSTDDLEAFRSAISHLSKIPMEDRKQLLDRIDSIDQKIIEETKAEAAKLRSKVDEGLMSVEEARNELMNFSRDLLRGREIEFRGRKFVGEDVDLLRELLYIEDAVRMLEARRNTEENVVSSEIASLARRSPSSATFMSGLRGISPETVRKYYLGQYKGNRLYLKRPIVTEDGEVIEYVHTPPIGRDIIVNRLADSLTKRTLGTATNVKPSPGALSAAKEATKMMAEAASKRSATGALKALGKGGIAVGKGVKSLLGFTPLGAVASAFVDLITEPIFMKDMGYETGGEYLRDQAERYIPAFMYGGEPSYMIPVGHGWKGPTGTLFRHSMDTLGSAANAAASPITAVGTWASALDRSTGIGLPRMISDPIAVLYTRLANPERYGGPLTFIPNYLDEFDKWSGLGLNMTESYVINIMNSMPDAEIRLDDGSSAKWKDLTDEQKMEYAKGVADEIRASRQADYEKIVKPLRQ